MPNWLDIENKLCDILSDDYYRKTHRILSPRSYARERVAAARGQEPALATYTGEVTVVELKHPARPGCPTRLIRGFDTRRCNSLAGSWWIDGELFDRFQRASCTMPTALRDQAIKDFMRARSAVSFDFNNMGGIAELNLPSGSRTPAIAGKAHYQRLITDAKHQEYEKYYVPNVFFIGGDLQFYVCIPDPNWIRVRPLGRGAAA